MDVSYGIGVTNRFQVFLDEDGDPDAIFEIDEQKKDDKPPKKQDKKTKGDVKQKQNQQQTINKKEPLQTANAKKDETVREPSSKPPRQQREDRRQGNRNVVNNTDENRRPDVRRNRERRPPREDTDPQAATSSPPDFKNERDTRDRPERGRGFRGRGGRGRGYYGGRDNRGKREYERHSGSDKSSVKPQDKRDGSGSHNWGNVKDEVKDVTSLEMNTSNVSEDAEWSAQNEDPEAKEKGAENAEEETEAAEETKEMTLDEYKALMTKEREKIAARQFNVRKAGEGEDQGQWKKTYVLKKDRADAEARASEDRYVRERSSKPTIDIEIKFAEYPSRGGGGGSAGRGGGRRGRRGRGGPSGGGGAGGRGGGGFGGGAGGPFGGNSRKTPVGGSAPKMDDENDFPVLMK